MFTIWPFTEVGQPLCYCIIVRALESLPPWPRWWQGEVLTLSVQKTSEIIAERELTYQIGAGARGRQEHVPHVKMADRGAGPKTPVSVAWGKKRLVERWTQVKCMKVWKINWLF